jgi:hypothetical protein
MITIMSILPATSPPAKTQTNWPAIIQLLLSALAAISLLGVAVIVVVTNLIGSFSTGIGNAGLTQPFMVAGSLVFVSILVLPSAWYSWKQIANPGFEPAIHPERKNFVLFFTISVLVVEAGILALGNLVAQNDQISWFLLPPFNIMATGLPALWLVYLGTRGLIPGLPKRKWGVFAVGLVLAPLIILILELLLLIGLGILVLLWSVVDPNLSNQLTNLAFRLQYAAPNMDQILKILLPFLTSPGILFIAFAFFSVLIPLIEETLKPLGVWFLAGQKITPAQGFGYGILSGAGFGLFENLGNTSGVGAGWAIVAASRMSTLLLHSFTAGLVGWALASAWSQRRFLRLSIAFAIAILIHGLWNGMAVLSLATSLQDVTNISNPLQFQQISTYASIGIIVLGILVLIGFVGFNSFLRRNLQTTVPLISNNGDMPGSSENTSLPSTGNQTPHTAPEADLPNPPTPGEISSEPANSLQHLVTGENSNNTTGK